MHDTVYEWVKSQVDSYGLEDDRVLEVGSLNVNGSVRNLFAGPYIGVDFREGPGVDEVMNAHRLRFAAGHFDLVVSTEMLEHDDAFWISMKEMGRVLRKGGHLLVTTRGNGFKPHGHPDDFFRFMPSARETLLRLAHCDVVELGMDPKNGIFAHGIKT
jgi:SAM-dependent methyltransferase